jgi:hypothetical protein
MWQHELDNNICPLEDIHVQNVNFFVHECEGTFIEKGLLLRNMVHKRWNIGSVGTKRCIKNQWSLMQSIFERHNENYSYNGQTSDGIRTGYHPNESEELLLLYLAGRVFKIMATNIS